LVADLASVPGPSTPAPTATPPVDLEAVIRKARAEGAEEARKALAADLREARLVAEAASAALAQVELLRPQILRQSAADVGHLVVNLARRVLGDALALHPDALPGLVDQAVRQLPDGDDLTIRVAPDDVARVRDALDDRFEDKVVGDPAITAGCRVETRHASIDATLATALAAIEAEVRVWMEGRG
jgi:flagellar biosynthesis/type III secretory pathway protein FliH